GRIRLHRHGGNRRLGGPDQRLTSGHGHRRQEVDGVVDDGGRKEAAAAGARVYADVDGVGAGDQGGDRDVVREGRVIPAVSPARDAPGVRLIAGRRQSAGPVVGAARVNNDLWPAVRESVGDSDAERVGDGCLGGGQGEGDLVVVVDALPLR